jgi:hypothetical protein
VLLFIGLSGAFKMVKLPKIKNSSGRCKACGADTSPWDKFCRNCGVKIVADNNNRQNQHLDFLSVYDQSSSGRVAINSDAETPIGRPQGDEISRQNLGPSRKIRMIDWIWACGLTIAAPLTVGLGALAIGLVLAILVTSVGKDTIGGLAMRYTSAGVFVACIAAAALSAPLAAIANFLGYVFDPTQDRMSFPTYVIRRSVPISEIRDANAETITTRRTFDPNKSARLAGDFSWKPTRKVTTRSHVVTVSGDFGVRIMRFGARYKRDQFLSILRAVAPQCRITRAVNID